MKRVFVCDDEEHILKLIKIHLEQNGCQVTTALNGKDAKAKLAANEFDLAVLDYVMPFADGVEVLQYMREELGIKIPVIILSQEAGPDLEARAMPFQPVRVVNQTGKTDWSTLLES